MIAAGWLLTGCAAKATILHLDHAAGTATLLRADKGADDTETYWIRVGATTGLFAIALQEAVDFSLQIPGNAVLFALLCGMAVHRPRERWREALPA